MNGFQLHKRLLKTSDSAMDAAGLDIQAYNPLTCMSQNELVAHHFRQTAYTFKFG